MGERGHIKKTRIWGGGGLKGGGGGGEFGKKEGEKNE